MPIFTINTIQTTGAKRILRLKDVNQEDWNDTTANNQNVIEGN